MQSGEISKPHPEITCPTKLKLQGIPCKSEAKFPLLLRIQVQFNFSYFLLLYATK